MMSLCRRLRKLHLQSMKAWKNGEIGEEGSNVFEIAEKAFEPYLEDYINDK